MITTTKADAPPAAGPSLPGRSASTPWRQPTRPLVRKLHAKWLVGVAVVSVMLVAAWFGLRALGSAHASEAVVTYEVAPRSFDVLLSEKGELDAANKIEIKCEVEGRTRIIWLVPEGKQVEKGELLVELASDQIDDKIQQQELKEAGAKVAYEAAVKEHEIQRDKNASDVRKAELALTIARLKLDKYEKGDWVQQQRDADLEIERAKAVLERTTEDLRYSEELVKKKYITMSDYKDDQFEKLQAEMALEKAELAKKILHEYNRPTEMEQARSDVHEAEKELERVKKSAEANDSKSEANVQGKLTEWTYTKQQLDKLREQKSKCRITAPSAGLVVYANEDSGWRGGSSRIAEGEEVYERQSILSIPDTSSMKVIVRIHEAKTDRIKLGQAARIEMEGLPGREFSGKVAKIAAVADSRNRWLNPDLKEYRTEILLDQSDPTLKPGVTARAEIFVERVENALAVPVQAVYSKGGKSYVFVEKGSSAEPVEVALGRSNDAFVEVLAGLTAGGTLRMVVDDSLKRKLPEAAEEATEAPPTDAQRQRYAGRPEQAGEQQRPHAPEGGERRPRRAVGAEGKPAS